MGYSPWGHKASDTTGHLTTHSTGHLCDTAVLTDTEDFSVLPASFVPRKHPKVTPRRVTPGHLQTVFRKILSPPCRQPRSIESGGGWGRRGKGPPTPCCLNSVLQGGVHLGH